MQIFDSHFHIIDPNYPLKANKGFIPKPFTLSEYKQQAKRLNIIKGTVVTASYQEYDQTYLLNALDKLGEGFYGVTQLSVDQVTEKKVMELAKKRVRGIRFNIYNGMILSLNEIERLAKLVYELAGWHVDLHITSAQLEELAASIQKLPAVVIDHLGKTTKGFSTLLKLVSKGVKVKASGFGRVDFDVKKAIRRIHAENPEALFFGTDLPSTRVSRSFQDSDIELVIEALGENEARKVLFSNAEKWYDSNFITQKM